MSNVEETYKRTMKAEGTETNDLFDFDNSQRYTFSNDVIREIYDDNKELCEKKNLTIEQMLDSFVLSLVDKGMPQDEAEEVCEVYDRTDGQFFSEDGDEYEDNDDEFEDDPDMPPSGNPDYDDDDEDEDDTEIFEV